jgi:hypothetical protein
MAKILTNTANHSIVLTLNNVTSSDSNIISLESEKSVLYDSIIITNELDPNYNVPLIQNYIDNGILVEEILDNPQTSELQLLPPGNLTINLSTGIPELFTNIVNPHVDNLQVLPVTDKDGKLLCIYYKSPQGISISTDFGTTQVLINNSNLLYPEEITSFAAQAYDSIGGNLVVVKRLFIGTLREGVKTFTPGINLTYVDFEPNVAYDIDSPLFKNSVTTTTITKNELDILDPSTNNPKIVTSFPSFCATYILSITNSPSNSGCPILIASRSQHSTVTTTTYVNSITHAIISSSTVTTAPVYYTKINFKYLHDNILVGDIVTPTIPEINWPPYFQDSNHWVLLQENGTSQNHPEIIIYPTMPSHILDVITEYNNSGALFMLKSDSSINTLFHLVTSENLSSIPVINQYILPTQLTSIKINNISILYETVSTNYNVFVTIPEQIWRYSSASYILGETGWTPIIYDKQLTITPYTGNTLPSYLSTNCSDGILTPSSSSILKNLCNFILVPKVHTTNGYIGLLATEIGLIFYDLKLVNNIFTTDVKQARILLNNLAKSIISDIKVFIRNENIYALTCSYKSQIPLVYNNNTQCLQLVNDNSTLVEASYYLKPDVEHLIDSIFYVKPESFILNTVQSTEQKSYDPVLLDYNHNYTLISPTYTFKMSGLSQDTILVTALSSFLAYKYYFPTVSERIVSSINKIEKNILQLNEYEHSFRMPNIASIDISTPVGVSVSVNGATSVLLPGSFIDNGIVKTSFVCIASNGKVVLPTKFTQEQPTIGQYQTTIAFAEPFKGTIFMQETSTIITLAGVSGFFATILHNRTKYPQVILDSSVIGLLNDIKYIDDARLEISFLSSVNTTVTLI